MKANVLKILSTVVRAFLCIIMGWAVYSKLFNTSGKNPILQFMLSIRAYQVVPEIFVKPLVYVILTFEILTVIMFFIGLKTKLFSLLLGLLLIVFIIGIIQAAIRGLNINCGCFSAGGELLPGEKTRYTFEIARDFFCVLTCVYLYIFPKTFLSLDNALNKF